MRMTAWIITIATVVVGLIGSALAADMTGADLKTFISGKTVYIQTTAASATGTPGQGIIYWAEDGSALYKTPTGAMWHGKWTTKDNTLCADWKEKPNNPCTRWDKTGDKVTILDAASGQARATVIKTAAGNAEKLAP